VGVKRPGREADHSHPSSAEVKECVELYLHSPNTPSRLGAQLKHRDLTFTLCISNFFFFVSSSLSKFKAECPKMLRQIY
jgi:hypothetical protein